MKHNKAFISGIAFLSCMLNLSSCNENKVFQTKCFITSALPLINNSISEFSSFQNTPTLNEINADTCIYPIKNGLNEIKANNDFKLARVISKDNIYLIGVNGNQTIDNTSQIVIPGLYQSTIDSICDYYSLTQNQLILDYSTFESVLLYLGGLTADTVSNTVGSTNIPEFAILPEPYASRAISNSEGKLVRIGKIEVNDYFGLFIKSSLDENSYIENYLYDIDMNLRDLSERDSREVKIKLTKNTYDFNLTNFGLDSDLLTSIQLGEDSTGSIVVKNYLSYVYPNLTKDSLTQIFGEISENSFSKYY